MKECCFIRWKAEIISVYLVYVFCELIAIFKTKILTKACEVLSQTPAEPKCKRATISFIFVLSSKCVHVHLCVHVCVCVCVWIYPKLLNIWKISSTDVVDLL